MRTPSLFSRGHRGFTLIELLTVTGILLLLAMLILPAFKSAQNNAKRAKSLSNLHTIGVGLGQYLGDNQNYFPPACNTNFTSGFWCDTLAPYLPSPITLNKFDTGAKFNISPVLVDPLLPRNRHHPQGDYGANSDLFYGPTGWPITTSPISSLALQGRLSKVVAVMTAEATTITPPCGSWSLNRKDIVTQPPESWGSSGRPSDRGLGTYLCLFADLHTETIATNDFVDRRKDLMSVNP